MIHCVPGKLVEPPCEKIFVGPISVIIHIKPRSLLPLVRNIASMGPSVAPKLTSVDLFAGCGGLTRGLEDAGFECIAFNELNEDAAASFSANFPNAVPYVGSIADVMDDEALKVILKDKRVDNSIDLVCGGPPCQGFSGIGHRRTHAVQKADIPTNHLFHEMIRVIKGLRPKAFLFENVQGILEGKWTQEGQNGEIFWDVWSGFSEIDGYVVQPALLHGYGFGVPQNRPRVFIVGVKRELLRGRGIISQLKIPDASRRKNLNWRATRAALKNRGGLVPKWERVNAPDLIDVLSDLDFDGWSSEKPQYVLPPTSEFQMEMRRKMGPGEPLTDHQFSSHKPRIRKKFQYMIDNKIKRKEDLPRRWRTKKFNQRVTPRRWGVDGKPWITATSLPDDYIHYSRPRTFSVREWARIQTFPDHHVFKGKRTTGGTRRAGDPSKGNWDRDLPKYTQIGNAVPPRMAKSLGIHIAGLIGGQTNMAKTHFPVGHEQRLVNKITQNLGAEDYVTCRMSRRAAGFESASGSDADAPQHLRAFLQKWGLVDFESMCLGENRVADCIVISYYTKHPLEITVGFMWSKSRGDMRYWPKAPFKRSLTGDVKFHDLLIFMIRNKKLILAVVGNIQDELIRSVVSETGALPSERIVKELVGKMVDCYDAGWIPSKAFIENQSPKHEDVVNSLNDHWKQKDSAYESEVHTETIEIKAATLLSKHLSKVVCCVPARDCDVKPARQLGRRIVKKRHMFRVRDQDNLGRKFNVNNNIVAHEVNSQGLMLDVDVATSMVNIISPMDDGFRIIASYDFNRLRNESIKRNPLTIWITAVTNAENTHYRYTSIKITRPPIFGDLLNLIDAGEAVFNFNMYMHSKRGMPKGESPYFKINTWEKIGELFAVSEVIKLEHLSKLRSSNLMSYENFVSQAIAGI